MKRPLPSSLLRNDIKASCDMMLYDAMTSQPWIHLCILSIRPFGLAGRISSKGLSQPCVALLQEMVRIGLGTLCMHSIGSTTVSLAG